MDRRAEAFMFFSNKEGIMSEDTLDRLKIVGAEVIKAFEAWTKKKKDHALTEAAMDSVHELRKVAARLEVELVMAERETQSAGPLPIPSHRSSLPHQQMPQPQEEAAPLKARKPKGD